MFQKILGFIATIGSCLVAMFYVLMRQAKEEQKAAEEKNSDLSENLEALMAGEKSEKEKRKENEELKSKMSDSNNLDSFNACNELLQK